MTNSDRPSRIDIIDRRIGFEGFFRFELIELRHARFEGGMTAPLSREILHIGPTVVILPYDPKRDRVVLIEQFRCGAIDHPGGPWLIEVPAGLAEEGEDPALTARRELLEECGLAAEAVEPIGVYSASPGAVNERSSVFVARIDSDNAGGLHGLASENEDIRSLVIEADTAFEWIDSSRIVAANALISLRWLQVHRDGLRQRWQ